MTHTLHYHPYYVSHFPAEPGEIVFHVVTDVKRSLALCIIDNIPASYYIFGHELTMTPIHKCNKNYIYEWARKMLITNQPLFFFG